MYSGCLSNALELCIHEQRDRVSLVPQLSTKYDNHAFVGRVYYIEHMLYILHPDVAEPNAHHLHF